MELIITNLVCMVYFIVTLYYVICYKHNITEASMHHIVSHSYIVLFIMISVNLYVIQGYKLPLLIVALHAVQHVIKENIRMAKGNKWTPDIKDDNTL